MENRFFSRDNSLLPPLLIGVISSLGICVILLFALFGRQDQPIPPTQAITPFKYALLATETMIPPSKFESATSSEIRAAPTITTFGELETPLVATSEGSVNGNVISFATTPEQNNIPTEAVFTPTITITADPLFSQSQSLSAGTYDDSNSQILRFGVWTRQNVNTAFEHTLLVSNQDGNYLAFSFIGSKMMMGYQSSSNAGEFVVNIDGLETTLTQLVGNAWFSPELNPGTHYVILTHLSGASVNLDYIDILSEE